MTRLVLLVLATLTLAACQDTTAPAAPQQCLAKDSVLVGGWRITVIPPNSVACDFGRKP